MFEFEREREEFGRRVQEIEEHNKAVIGELEARIEMFREEFQDLKDTELITQEELLRRESDNTLLRKTLRQGEDALDQLRVKCNHDYLLLEEEVKEQKNKILEES